LGAELADDNTGLLRGDDIPKSYDDLLLPEWKGKLGLDLNYFR